MEPTVNNNNIVTILADNDSMPFDSTTSTDASQIRCADHKQMVTGVLMPYEILRYLNPVDDNVSNDTGPLWMERSDAWRGIFLAYVGLLGSVYFMLGMFSIVMLIKKDCVRLPTKTFFAVYSTIAVLGFSRALLLALDPYDLLGFISEHFSQWIIITRLLGSLGFPSLVASYTLMVFTLLKIAKANPGEQWYHKWRFVVPIVVVPYVIAIGAEVIGYIAEYPGLLSVIICEIFFALWGVTVVITYLIAGARLMHQLRKRERNTVRVSGAAMNNGRSVDELANQNNFAAQEYRRHHKHNRRTARKIAIITYVTVAVAFLYSLLTFGNIIMVCWFLFRDCIGFMGTLGNSDIWLGLHISTRATEIILATIMLYSITDVTGVVKVASRMFAAMCCCKRMKVTKCGGQTHPLAGGMLNNGNNTSNRMITQGSPSHHDALISADKNTNNSNHILTDTESLTELPEVEVTTTATIFQESVDLVGTANLGDSEIQLEATDDCSQENHPAVNNAASNSQRTFLLRASSGDSSSSIESTAVTYENSQQCTEVSKQSSATQTRAETAQALVQTEIHLESPVDRGELYLNSVHVPCTSPADQSSEHLGTGMEPDHLELECQTEPPSASSGSIPRSSSNSSNFKQQRTV